MKNLEDEYRKSQHEQIPLLWEKIEKKLPEKKKKKKSVFLSPYLGICAAAVLLFLLVPNLFHLGDGRSLSESSPQDITALVGTTEGGKQTARDESLENEEVTILNDYKENEDIIMQEKSAENPVGEVCEIMKVSAYSEINNLQIFTLERADGSMLQAFLPNAIDIIPQIGESYLFTVIKDSDNTDYLKIENVIEIQN